MKSSFLFLSKQIISIHQGSAIDLEALVGSDSCGKLAGKVCPTRTEYGLHFAEV